MNRLPIIGLTGYAQSGKDSVADVLMGRGYTRFAFGDVLKAVAYGADPFVQLDDGTFTRLHCVVDEGGWDAAKQNSDVRRFLQRLGTEGGRAHLGERVWVEAVMRQVLGAQSPVVISDVRFPNEVAAVKALGGLVARVERPGVGAVNGHSSDAHIGTLAADLVIGNDGTLSDLAHEVENLAHRLESATSTVGGC